MGGKSGSAESKRCAGEARSKEDKRHVGEGGGKGGSKEYKRRVGEARSKEDKRNATEVGGRKWRKQDKQCAGEVGGSSEDKWCAGEARRLPRALKYASQTIADTAAVGYLWTNHKECEGGAYHLDDDEDAILCSKDNPCTHEFKRNWVGTSLASTARSFWEQDGHDVSRHLRKRTLLMLIWWQNV